MNTTTLRLTSHTATARYLRRLLLLLAVLASVLSLGLGTAAPAQAAQAQLVQGRPGAVVLNGPMITGSDYRISGMNLSAYSTSGLTARRSAASTNTQNIYLSYTVQRWANGGWQNFLTSQTYSGASAYGGGGVSFPAWSTYPPREPNFQYAYRITAAIAWYDARTGAMLGVEVMVPTLSSEVRCATVWKRCTTSPGYIVM